jgi:hypothetical protein
LLALTLAPKERPRPFVLDEQDSNGLGDRDPDPVVARGEMAGQVESKGRLADAAVAVDHHVTALGDDRVIGAAEDRVRARFVDGRELVERHHAVIDGL